MKGEFAKKLGLSFLLTFFMILGAAVTIGMNQPENERQKANPLKKNQDRRIPLDLSKNLPKATIVDESSEAAAPIEKADSDYDYSGFADNQRGVIPPGAGAGMTIGLTIHDIQHMGRMTRQIAWRESHNIHITWMLKNRDFMHPYIRLTKYQFWDATVGQIKWSPLHFPWGGDDLHASGERSGYSGIDIMSDGRALVYNHYDQDGLEPYDYLPTIWPDNPPLSGKWGWKQGVPDPYDTDVQNCAFPDTPPISNWTISCPSGVWPYVAFHLYDNGAIEDTIIHILAREAEGESISSDGGRLAYWRRFGAGPDPNSPGLDWASHVVDTITTIGYVVECAQEGVATGYEGKVALVWIAPWPEIPGDIESATPNGVNFLVEQNANDIYGIISMDGGVTWGDKFNITQNDFLDKGWAPLSDLSALIDSDGRLHVVYSARQFINTNDGAPQEPIDMDWPLFPIAGRIFHWSDEQASPDYISIVKDASHDWTMYDSICMGGQWSMMSVTKPMISQCDDKLYVIFSQYQDVKNGIWDNCHITNWINGDYIGSANSMLYFAVSDMINGGLNWDPARALTDFTQRCDTGFTGIPTDPVNPLALNVCHSHAWASMTRFGMEVGPTDNFYNATVVNDASWNQTESPDYYLDVVYVDDLWPGAVILGEGTWAIDPIKWFRFPCVDAEAQPVLALDPAGIYLPDWGKTGEPVEYTVTMSNVGNTPLTISDIRPEELNNFNPGIDGWLAVNDNGFGGNISEALPGNSFDITLTINNGGIVDELYSPAVLTGRIIFESDSPGGSDTLNISFIVADTLQIPEMSIIYTDQIGLAVGNDGSYGCGLYDTLGQMDFHVLGSADIECDTCSKGIGNFAHKYLYDASPFILTNIDNDRRISASVHNMDWLSRYEGVADGLRPLDGMSEIIEGANADYLKTGIACSADSTVGLKSIYVAPQHPDTGEFIVQILKYYNLTDETIDDLFVGTVEDWDIPSDSGVRNTSDFDVDRKVMYMTGWEAAQADTFCNSSEKGNDCNESDLRYGGSTFFGGFQYKSGGIGTDNKVEKNQGVFTAKTVSWLGDNLRGHLPAERLYDTLNSAFYGYSPWWATDWGAGGAESLYRDLTMITSFGQYALGVEDTLTFVRFLVSEYQGGLAGIQESIDKARAYTLHYLCCDIWGKPGDANTDYAVNILDVVYIINSIYKNGDGVKWPSSTYDPDGESDWPTDNCDNLMNVDESITGNGHVNILDVVYLINFLYKNGPSPECPYSIF